MALTKISTDGVKDDAITSGKIPANAVGASELADNAVDTNAIANNAITQQKIGADAVQGTIIADDSITTSKIADNAVTTAKLASGAADLLNDSSPQLGGDLNTNSHNINLDDNHKVNFGDSNDLNIYHQSGIGYIDDLVGSGDGVTIRAKNIRLQSNANIGAKSAINCNASAAVELFHNDVKQLETTENGIKLPKGCIRGIGGSKVILGGTLAPANDVSWNFSFSTNDNGYNTGYVFHVKFWFNHWNTGSYYKYIESIVGGRVNVTGYQRVDLINNLGTGGSSFNSGHIDYEVSLTGGTREGTAMSLFKVKYDADSTPNYIGGYYLEVNYSNQIGTITVT